MPAVQGRSREQIRQAVGAILLGSQRFRVLETTSAGTTTTLVDTKLYGPDDEYNGWWVRPTEGADDAVTRRVSSFVDTSDTATVAPAWASAPGNATDYELWYKEFNPDDIDRFIVQAILDVYGRYFEPEESLALHLHRDESRYDIPTEFDAIWKLEYRSKVDSILLDSADSVWSQPTNVTTSVDSEVKRVGSSNKFVVDAALGAGASVGNGPDFSATNLSRFDYCEFWIRSTIATAASDLQVRLRSVLAGVYTTRETLAVPALTADTWTFVRVALANPEDDTAIVDVQLFYNVDIGAVTLWIDEVRAVRNSEADWSRLSPHIWWIDKEGRDIVFRQAPPYGLLKIVGGSNPTLMSADADVSDIPESYLIYQAAGLAALSVASFKEGDEWASKARLFLARAEAERSRLPMPMDVRLTA